MRKKSCSPAWKHVSMRVMHCIMWHETAVEGSVSINRVSIYAWISTSKQQSESFKPRVCTVFINVFREGTNLQYEQKIVLVKAKNKTI